MAKDNTVPWFEEFPKRCPEMDRNYGRTLAWRLQDGTLVFEPRASAETEANGENLQRAIISST